MSIPFDKESLPILQGTSCLHVGNLSSCESDYFVFFVVPEKHVKVVKIASSSPMIMISSSCEHLLCSYYGLNDEVYSDVKIIYNEELFFCGIRVDKVDFSEIYDSIQDDASVYVVKQVITLNPEIAYDSWHNEELHKHFLMPLSLFPMERDCDGSKRKGYIYKGNPYWACGIPPVEGENLSFFSMELSQCGSQAVENLKKRYKFKLAGIEHGYSSEAEALKKIQESVQMYCWWPRAPEARSVIYRNKEKLGVKLALGIGGSFDVWAGIKKRAPKWMRNSIWNGYGEQD